MFGKIKDFKVKDSLVIVQYENIEARINVISSSIVNFFVPIFINEQKSKAVEDLQIKSCEFEVIGNESNVEIVTKDLTIKVYDEFKVDIYNKEGRLICEDYRGDREPFVKNAAGRLDLAAQEGHKPTDHMDYKVFVPKSMDDDMYFYGFGERSGHLNKKGCHYINWNTDDPSPHGETYEKLYKSIPFFITMKDEEAFGLFFDNTFEAHFDLGKENSEYYYFGAVDGNIDYYFMYGPTIKQVIKEYTYLTGTTPLPQLWTLGYQQCRWAYCPEENVMNIASKFREKDIPCDTIYLDIEYMDDFRVFTWDKNKFKDPKKMIDNLNHDGFKLVTIIDPGVKVDKEYKIYDEGMKNGYFATDKNGITYTNWVWPGYSVFPDFMNSEVRNWWADNQKIMMDYGVAGIWNDMNEPASFNGPLPDDIKFNEDGRVVDHKEIHNAYGHMMDKATYEGIKKATNKRPFVVTRACYSGTQKYSTVWTGDNQSTWEHLRMSVPMLMNLGLSGMAFAGTDVGGFGYDCTKELLSRWVQVGAFTPLFRNHTTIYSRDQEPWAFDKLTEDINRKYIKLRYKLIPYMYDAFYKGENDGLPVMRALPLEFQGDEKTYEINDQFMFGENIMVAPVLEQGKKARMVYLPKGENWIDYWTKEKFVGGQYIVKQTPLDVCPIYVKEGSIIPNYPVQSYIGEKEIDTLILDIYVSEDKASYKHYQDDGSSFEYKEGKYNLYNITVESKEELNINIDLVHDGYNKKYKNCEIHINGTNYNKVKINNEEVNIEVRENITLVTKKLV